jgi:four helix bundle protein
MEQGFKSLIIWQKGIELVKETYSIARTLPKAEQYGLISQMCRSAVSVPSNIAEGNRRGTSKDYSQFLRIAHGSLAELETQFFIVTELYPDTETQKARELTDEISRMISAIIKKLHA